MDKVKYWLESAEEDLNVAESLFEKGHYLWMGFVCHLIVEKGFKAGLSKLDIIPPKIHNLVRLAELSKKGDGLSDEQKNFLETLNPLHIEARYQEHKDKMAAIMTKERSIHLLNETKEFFSWIRQSLSME